MANSINDILNFKLKQEDEEQGETSYPGIQAPSINKDDALSPEDMEPAVQDSMPDDSAPISDDVYQRFVADHADKFKANEQPSAASVAVQPPKNDTAAQITNAAAPQKDRLQVLLDQYNDAQDQRRHANLASGLTLGAGQIGQALAAKFGGHIGANEEGAKAVKDIGQQSASDVKEKLALMKAITGGQNPKTLQQAQYLTKSGDPVIFNPNDGSYVNAVTREQIKNSGELFRNIMYSDAFGNRQMMGPQGSVMAGSSKRPELPSAPDARKQVEETFNPDKEQRKALDEEKKRIDDLSKNVNEKIDASNRILKAIDEDSKLSLAVIKTQMPRLAGEVGNLNQAEQEVWTGSQAAADRAAQYIKTLTSSKLTDDNKKELRAILGPFLQTASDARNSIMDSSANSLEMAYKVPSDYTKKYYGEIRKLSPGQEKLITPKSEKKAAPSSAPPPPKTVKIKGPSGQIADIDEQFADQYLAKPGYSRVTGQ